MPLYEAQPGEPVVRPTGWVRPAYVWIADDEHALDDQDGFTAEARLGADVVLPTAPVRARVELELLPEPVLKDAWVAASPAPFLEVRAGQLKVPFSVAQLASDTRHQLPEAPRVVAAAGIGRDIGATATLQLPILDEVRAAFTTGAFDGEGPNRLQNVNQRLSFVERALITPFGARAEPFEGTGRGLYLGVGGGWLYDYDGDGATAVETNTFGAELQAAWGLLSLQGEWMDAELIHASATVADYHANGWYAQAGCFVPAPWAREHVEVVGRYEQADPNTAYGDTPDTETDAFQAVYVVTGGVNLYAWSEAPRFHDLKLQVAYAHPEPLEGDDRDDDRLSIAATARF